MFLTDILTVKAKTKFINKDFVNLERYSEGFRIRIEISLSKDHGYIESGIEFLDLLFSKMTDPCVKIEIEERCPGADKTEIVRSVGFAFGEGLRKLVEKRKLKASVSSIYTDGNIMCMFAVNTRKNFGKRTEGANLQIIGKLVSGSYTEHFFAFFDGFAQGMEAEVNIAVNFVKKKKNQMVFFSKAFAFYLRQLLSIK